MVGIFLAFVVLCLVVAFWKVMMSYTPLATEDHADVSFDMDKDVYLRQQKRTKDHNDLEEMMEDFAGHLEEVSEREALSTSLENDK